MRYYCSSSRKDRYGQPTNQVGCGHRVVVSFLSRLSKKSKKSTVRVLSGVSTPIRRRSEHAAKQQSRRPSACTRRQQRLVSSSIGPSLDCYIASVFCTTSLPFRPEESTHAYPENLPTCVQRRTSARWPWAHPKKTFGCSLVGPFQRRRASSLLYIRERGDRSFPFANLFNKQHTRHT